MAALVLVAATPASGDEGPLYVPGRFWERRVAETLGMDTAKLDDAIAFALAHESSAPVNLRGWLEGRLEGEPDNAIIGPVRERSGINGMIVRGRYIAAQWGDTRRVDMAFSLAKPVLATLAGLAADRGLIGGLDARVAVTSAALFADPRNAAITWNHLIRQTSEWQGTLWGKPDAAVRRGGPDRALQTPGTFWEDHDVRADVLALALLQAWREPLPDVLREQVTTPIGMSTEWRWHGYENSRVEIDGTWTTSVSGSGHWGGGLWIATRDLARLGLLYLRGGSWGDREVLPPGWVETAVTPTPIAPTFGAMLWLNTGRALWPSAPAGSYAMLGEGGHVVWMDPVHDLVVAVRWLEPEHVDGFLARVLASVRPADGAP